MKIESVIIKDSKADKFFAFLRQFPGVCAQGNTKEEVMSKIDTHFHAFIDKMDNNKIEFTESEITTI